MIINFTIINDFYFPEKTRPMVSYIVLVYAFMRAFAITLGDFIKTHISGLVFSIFI